MKKEKDFKFKALFQLTFLFCMLTISLLLAVKFLILPFFNSGFFKKDVQLKDPEVVKEILQGEPLEEIREIDTNSSLSNEEKLQEVKKVELALEEEAAKLSALTEDITPKPTVQLKQEVQKIIVKEEPIVKEKIIVKKDAIVTEQTTEIEELKMDPQKIQQLRKIIAGFKIPNLNIEDLSDIIYLESRQYKIDPLLTTAIIYVESTFNRYAQSPNGKAGLMQIYPDDAKKITKRLGLPYLGDITLFHPLYNVRLGLYKLSQLIRETGSVDEGIKAYSHRSSGGKREVELFSDKYLERVQKFYTAFKNK